MPRSCTATRAAGSATRSPTTWWQLPTSAAFLARQRYDLARASALPWLFGILTKEIARRHRTEKARFRALERAWSDQPADGLADQVAADVSAPGSQSPARRRAGAPVASQSAASCC